MEAGKESHRQRRNKMEREKMCSKEADSQGFSLWKDVVHVEGEEAVDENRVQSRTLSLFYFLLY